jgi:hypothetical protein
MTSDLYTFGTPTGCNVSVMLEAGGLAYRVHPVSIGEGAPFAPAFLKISPNSRIPASLDTGPPGARRRQRLLAVRKRGEPGLSGRKHRPVPAVGRARALPHAGIAD